MSSVLKTFWKARKVGLAFPFNTIDHRWKLNYNRHDRVVVLNCFNMFSCFYFIFSIVSGMISFQWTFVFSWQACERCASRDVGKPATLFFPAKTLVESDMTIEYI